MEQQCMSPEAWNAILEIVTRISYELQKLITVLIAIQGT